MTELSKINSEILDPTSLIGGIYISRNQSGSLFDSYKRIIKAEPRQRKKDVYGDYITYEYSEDVKTLGKYGKGERWLDVFLTENVKVEDNHLRLLKEAHEALESNNAKWYGGGKKSDEAEGEENTETALLGSMDKHYMITLRDETQNTIEKLEQKQALAKLAIAQKLYKLEVFKREMAVVLSDLQRKMTTIKRAITIIEIYLGVDEELHQ